MSRSFWSVRWRWGRIPGTCFSFRRFYISRMISLWGGFLPFPWAASFFDEILNTWMPSPNISSSSLFTVLLYFSCMGLRWMEGNCILYGDKIQNRTTYYHMEYLFVWELLLAVCGRTWLQHKSTSSSQRCARSLGKWRERRWRWCGVGRRMSVWMEGRVLDNSVVGIVIGSWVTVTVRKCAAHKWASKPSPKPLIWRNVKDGIEHEQPGQCGCLFWE